MERQREHHLPMRSFLYISVSDDSYFYQILFLKDRILILPFVTYLLSVINIYFLSDKKINIKKREREREREWERERKRAS